MEELDLSQADISRALKVSRMTVSVWARGKGYPRGKNLRKLSRVLRTPVPILMEAKLNSQPGTEAPELHLLIQDRLKILGYSQEYFADQVGVSRMTASLWIKGRAKPGELNLNMLSQVLEVPLTSLLKALNQEDVVNPFWKLRVKKGLTKRALGEAINVTVKTISAWETGSQTPSDFNQARLHEFFELDAESKDALVWE